MERIDIEKKERRRSSCEPTHHSRTGRIISGLLVIGVGAVWLAKQAGVYFPSWLFTWEMLLIVIGLFVGIKHSFRGFGWLILMGVGGVFLMEHFNPDITLKRYMWPILIMAAGVMMIIRPKKKHHSNHWKEEWKKKQKEKWGNYKEEAHAFTDEGKTYTGQERTASMSDDDVLNSTSIFGGVKKNIISKNFKGGEITCVFGGAHINLMQADIHGEVVLEVNHIFGGSELVIPANWKVRSELVAIFGGIEDNRYEPQGDVTEDKVLVIRGNAVFGGIDIKSF